MSQCVCLSVCRCCGVRAVTHLQPCGPAGCPDSLCASGCAGGRHADRPCGSFPGKIDY